jgi:hypothetical protein
MMSPDGGSNSDGGGTVGGACTATAMASVIVPSFTGYSLSIVGDDAYWVEPGAKLTGSIRHMKLDGSGDAILVTAPMGSLIYGATAVGSDLYYFQEDDPSGSAVHMYKTSRATGGVGTQVGMGTFPGFDVNVIGGGVFGLDVSRSQGVFAVRGTDVFVSDGAELSRVSLTSGTKTAIAKPMMNGGILFPALVGSTVFYKELDGTIYSVSADAAMPSGTVLGTAKCGMVRSFWMSASSNGFACGELFGIDKIDPTGTMKSHVINTLSDKNQTEFNPSAFDGTTYYALPKEGTKSYPIYKIDFATNAITPVVCDVRAVYDARVTPTDLVYIEIRGDASNGQISLRRVAR